MSKSVGVTDDDFEHLLESIIQLENTLERIDGRLATVEERVDDLEQRTNLIQLVEDTDNMDGKQRSAALLLHLQKKIQRNGSDRIFLNRDGAEEALHWPDVDRTTLYTDMQRAARMVANEDVCWYETAEESRTDEAVLYLDLENGELPKDVLNRGD